MVHTTLKFFDFLYEITKIKNSWRNFLMFFIQMEQHPASWNQKSFTVHISIYKQDFTFHWSCIDVSSFYINLILSFQLILLTLCDKQEWIWKISGKSLKGWHRTNCILKVEFISCFICYYFLPFWRLSFHLAYSLLHCANAFKFN